MVVVVGIGGLCVYSYDSVGKKEESEDPLFAISCNEVFLLLKLSPHTSLL